MVPNILLSLGHGTTGVNYKNFVYYNGTNLLTNLEAAVNEDSGLLAIEYSGSEYMYFWLYDLEEALNISDKTYTESVKTQSSDKTKVQFKAKDLNSIKKLASVKIKKDYLKNKVGGCPGQGFDLDGDYLYLAFGQRQGNVGGNNKSYVVTLNWEYNESLPDRNRVISKVSAIENQGGVIKPYMGNALTENNKTFYPAEMEGIKVDTSGTKPVMYLGYKCFSRKANILKYIYNK